MKQLLQDLKHGKTFVVDAPYPQITETTLIVESTVSLISAGTERMLVEFGKANILEKARQQPDKVKSVLDKIAVDGLLTTVEAVQAKLNQPIPLGYSNVGVISAVGGSSNKFKPGDRVVSNGAHADVVKVYQNLCAKVPDAVSDEAAAFTVVASIGLQGIRLAGVTIGESVVVFGAGLIGLLSVQILRAHGCRVLAIDMDAGRLALAQSFGADVCNPGIGEDPVQFAMQFSGGRGADAVLVTASTKSSEIISQSARMSRKRGRVILVGVTGLELNRSEFYEKELTFQVSCSYGPGRYDAEYEENGHDYPLPYVRWTAQRNFEAILDLMASGHLRVEKLISRIVDFQDVELAYDALSNDRSALGILFRYSAPSADRKQSTLKFNVSDRWDQVSKSIDSRANKVSPPASLGFIGAGNYSSRMLIPAFKSAGARLVSVASAGGTSASIQARKSGFEKCTSVAADLIEDPQVNGVIIVTRHDSHSELVIQSLRAGKSVFVEKPLALTISQVDAIETEYRKSVESGSSPVLMVGFNRRFSPQVQKMVRLLAPIKGPKTISMLINAGHIPKNHWTQDNNLGGGRIIGEACHFIDLARFLIGAPITSMHAMRIKDESGTQTTEDKAVLTVGFADGSLASICYFSNGAASFPKERIEVFANGGILQLDNFRKLRGFGWPGFSKMNLWRQDKGQLNCANAFVQSLRTGGSSPIPPDEIFEVARFTIEAAAQIRGQ